MAPALAAIIACTGEKHSVTFTIVPFFASAAAGFEPVPGQRHLDGDILGDLGEDLAFFSMPS